VRVRPQYAAGWRELGRLLAGQGRDAEAVTCLRQAVELDPTDDEPRRLLREVTQRDPSGARPGQRR
jgi:cytochrome c-type biogenesis protein CcmH/NrfG